MRRILALDSGYHFCSVALYEDGRPSWRSHETRRGHGDVILAMIDTLLGDSGCAKTAIDVLAFGRGPGAFTSLRVAAGIVQGLAVGLERPVVAISSLAALAHGAYRQQQVERAVVAIDARMNQIYSAAYETQALGQSRAVSGEYLSGPDQVSVPAGHWAAVGNGWILYPALAQRCQSAGLQYVESSGADSAIDIAWLAVTEFDAGRAVAAELALPVYLRDQVVHTPPSESAVSAQ